jgi:hypothetical protein
VAAPALRLPRENVEQIIAKREATLRAAEHRYGGQVRACAQELVRTGATVVRLQNARQRGRIVRFRRGDSVLHLETTGPGQEQPWLQWCVHGAAAPGGQAQLEPQSPESPDRAVLEATS